MLRQGRRCEDADRADFDSDAVGGLKEAAAADAAIGAGLVHECHLLSNGPV
jgi:hypothetical protein